MKRYLVQYATGRYSSDSTIVDMQDDYVPANDEDFIELKKTILREKMPYAFNPVVEGGVIKARTSGCLTLQTTKILSISNLNN